MNQLISIIIVAYNSEKYIKSAIQSCLNQTYRNFEIIVIDDGSTDGTRKMVEEYIESDSIRYIYKQNGGVSSSRNSGIREARGQYLAFLDADDMFEPEKLMKQVKIMEAHPDCGMVHTDCAIIDTTGVVMQSSVNNRRQSRDGMVFDEYFSSYYSFVAFSTNLIRATCFNDIGMFDENFRVAQDYDLFLRLFFKYPVFVINEPLAKIRRLATSLGHSNETERICNMETILLKFVLKHREYFENKSIMLKAKWKSFYFYSAMRLWHEKSYKLSSSYFKKIRGLNLKIWIYYLIASLNPIYIDKLRKFKIEKLTNRNQVHHKNILHLVYSFDISGRSSVIHELNAAFNNNSFSSIVLSLTPNCLFLNGCNSDRVICINKKEGFDLASVLHIIKIVIKNKINIIHTHGKSAALYGIIVKRVCNIPFLVHTVHRTDGDVITNNKLGILLVSNTIDRVIAVSNSAAKYFIECNKYPAKKVAVIYNGIRGSKDCPSMLNDPVCYDIVDFKRKNSFVIGMVANFSYDKDFNTLIQAFSMLSKMDRDIGLVLVGDGPRYSEIKSIVSGDAAIHGKVLFLGFRSDVKRLLSKMDVFILSTSTEGLSIAILEAMDSKIPVVATNVGGVPEVINHRESGLLVSSKNADELVSAVLLLKNDKVIRERMIENAFNVVKEKFSLSQFLKEHDNIYNLNNK